MTVAAGRRSAWWRGLVGLVLAVVLAGCAAPAVHEASDGSGYNDADVAFADMMVPHHEQAIAMTRLALDHTQSAGVRQLARMMAAEQMPEIVQLQELLSTWGRPPAPTGMDMPGMAGMDAGGDGMMSDQQMRDLSAASGPAFDRLFLQMMVKHHGGGVAMAKTELSDGANADAQQIAQNISDSQQAQMTFMLHMLADG